MARVKATKVTTGYVVKRETMLEKPDPKHAGQMLKFKHRVEVSRVFHSSDAAQTYMKLCQKQWPDGDFYVHEKRKVAEAA
jgi:hypothetical protein